MPAAFLADQPGAQHQAVGDDLRLGGGFPEERQEIAGKAHGRSGSEAVRPLSRQAEASAPVV